MSAVTIGGDLVHYEVLGRGRTVVLLHGWLGSWRYWIPTMRQLQLRYRVYAVDLFGYGDSGKNPVRYPINQQIEMLNDFMGQLGIDKTGIIAHGLGAHVMTEFARHYPDKVVRMLLVSAPLFDPGDLNSRVPTGQRILLTPSSTTHNKPKHDPNQPLASKPGSPPVHSEETLQRRPQGLDNAIKNTAQQQDTGASEATVVNPNMVDRERLRQAAIARGSAIMRGEDKLVSPDEIAPAAPPLKKGKNPLRDHVSGDIETLLLKCFRRSDSDYDKLHLDVDRIDPAVLDYVTRHFDPGFMLDTLRALPMPIVIAHGENDPIIPAPNEDVWNYLTVEKDDKLLPVPFPGVGHFPMIESDSFLRLIGAFLETHDISKIEVKERWRRRSR